MTNHRPTDGTKNTATEKEQYITRDSILKLLSDDEVAKVSNAETAASLADGEEYVDLQQLEQGVRRALGPTPAANTLSKKSVNDKTWSKVLVLLQKVRADA